MTKSRKIKESPGDRVVTAVSYILCVVIFLAVSYPLFFVLIASFSDQDAIHRGEVWLWPVDPSVQAYAKVLSDPNIWRGYRNTIFYTVSSVLLSVTVVIPCAYALSRKDFSMRGAAMVFFLIAMYFSGGMVPTYLLIKDLKMLNTVWAMILPTCCNVFHLIIAKTFFENNLPRELREAAELDGCSDFRYFISVVLPLSKAIIAVVAIYTAIHAWNSYMPALMYLTGAKDLQPLQIVLRNLLLSTNSDVGQSAEIARTAEMLKYALIVVTTIPIMCVYPFIQKYFEKGVMIGSVKG